MRQLFAPRMPSGSTPDTQGAYHPAWRLVAIDGTTCDLPDTKENVDVGTRCPARRPTSAAEGAERRAPQSLTRPGELSPAPPKGAAAVPLCRPSTGLPRGLPGTARGPDGCVVYAAAHDSQSSQERRARTPRERWPTGNRPICRTWPCSLPSAVAASTTACSPGPLMEALSTGCRTGSWHQRLVSHQRLVASNATALATRAGRAYTTPLGTPADPPCARDPAPPRGPPIVRQSSPRSRGDQSSHRSMASSAAAAASKNCVRPSYR